MCKDVAGLEKANSTPDIERHPEMRRYIGEQVERIRQAEPGAADDVNTGEKVQ